MLSFIKKLAGSKPTPKGMIVCQNSDCREPYDLDHIVTVSDEDLMSFLSGGGAVVVGKFSGHPVLVDHARDGTKTDERDLQKFLESVRQVGWVCNKCKTNNSWKDSYRRPAVLRKPEFKYYTGDDRAEWADGHTKVFDTSDFDPPLPGSSLMYLLDGALYDTPKDITPSTCRQLILQHLNEAAAVLKRAKGTATQPEAAILILMKLKLSLAVRNSESWDSAESRIDRIIRS
jgi:hypothetical protein